jgi:hypothetical protein
MYVPMPFFSGFLDESRRNEISARDPRVHLKAQSALISAPRTHCTCIASSMLAILKAPFVYILSPFFTLLIAT